MPLDSPFTAPSATEPEPAPPQVESNYDVPFEPRDVMRMCALITNTERNYIQHRAPVDARNLNFWRGNLWSGKNIPGITQAEQYRAQRNEVFPILDTIATGLALSLPQVDLADRRIRTLARPARMDDPYYHGKRTAMGLNYFAELDDLQETLYEAVLCAMCFTRGGVLKTEWNATVGRIEYSYKLPWEVFFDTSVKKSKDWTWAFERFPIHAEDLKTALESGVYSPLTKNVAADVFPRALIEYDLGDVEKEQLRQQGLREYVLLHEFWDFRRGVRYHIHLETQQVLMAIPIQWEDPYVSFYFSPALGVVEGVPDVDHLAPIQQDIDELVNARREIVRRMAGISIVDSELFPDDATWEKFKNAKAWEVLKVKRPQAYATLQEAIAQLRPSETGFDFNKKLEEDSEHGRYMLGVSGAMRGMPENIRTAEEVDLIRGKMESRMMARSNRVVTAVTKLFRASLSCLQWAVRHHRELGWNPEELYASTIFPDDPPYDQWLQEILSPATSHAFRVMPFSPLMEDPNARRKWMVEAFPQLASIPQYAAQINWNAMARDTHEAFGMRTETVIEPQAEGAVPVAPGAPAPGGPAPLNAAPPMPGAPPPAAPPAAAGPPPGMPDLASLLGALGKPPGP